jgi:hypothetical protein
LASTTRDLIFIGGCARSGTTALCGLMNAHRRVLLGLERYFLRWRDRTVGPEHFEVDRFLDMQEGDTHSGPNVRRQFEELRRSKRDGECGTIGDKYPALFDVYDHVWKTFPAARVLYIVRDPRYVALSYQRRADNAADKRFSKGGLTAVREWNASVRATVSALQQGRPITVVGYERVFASRSSARRLFEAMGLDPDDADWSLIDSYIAYAAKVDKPLPFHLAGKQGLIRSYAAAMADWRSYRTLLDEHCLFSNEPRRGESHVAGIPMPASAHERGHL